MKCKYCGFNNACEPKDVMWACPNCGSVTWQGQLDNIGTTLEETELTEKDLTVELIRIGFPTFVENCKHHLYVDENFCLKFVSQANEVAKQTLHILEKPKENIDLTTDE